MLLQKKKSNVSWIHTKFFLRCILCVFSMYNVTVVYAMYRKGSEMNITLYIHYIHSYLLQAVARQHDRTILWQCLCTYYMIHVSRRVNLPCTLFVSAVLRSRITCPCLCVYPLTAPGYITNTARETCSSIFTVYNVYTFMCTVADREQANIQHSKYENIIN